MRHNAYLVQIVVLSNEFLQLRLHVDNLRSRELELDHWHARLFQMLQEPNFGRLQKHQASALAIRTTSGSSHAVDVITGIVRRIKLDDPVDSRDL